MIYFLLTMNFRKHKKVKYFSFWTRKEIGLYLTFKELFLNELNHALLPKQQLLVLNPETEIVCWIYIYTNNSNYRLFSNEVINLRCLPSMKCWPLDILSIYFKKFKRKLRWSFKYHNINYGIKKVLKKSHTLEVKDPTVGLM